MSFTGTQVVKSFTQVNHGTPDEVFPLLCPEREKDWLEGWDCEMVHSKSGYAEQDCVFTTSDGDLKTVWQITQYKPPEFLEFLRVHPGENVVKINIQLELRDDGYTNAFISYQYTALNENQNQFIDQELGQLFKSNMIWWEKALNHYLATGEKLLK